MTIKEKLVDSFNSIANEYRISERWREHFDELFIELTNERTALAESEYRKGWDMANAQACAEIEKNYQPKTT